MKRSNLWFSALLLGGAFSAAACDTATAEPAAATCGDGAKAAGEQCDDGNVLSGDGCSALCVIEYCGDGVVQTGLDEACDDGNFASEDGCSSSCQPDTPACAPPDPACTPVTGDEVRYADVVVEAPGHTGEGFFDSARCVNGVRGEGAGKGSFDVFSLRYGADDSYVVLRWSDAVVQNGPGADFAVFENGFTLSSGTGHFFMDQIVVELSQDGVEWVTFPHDYTAADETKYSKLPEDWTGFAGLTPVELHAENNPVDPFDPVAAGGDHFDLDDLPADGGLATAIKADGFTFIRLVSAASLTNPDTGATYLKDISSDGPDIDGVFGRYVVEQPSP